jgi:hypothetical protein
MRVIQSSSYTRDGDTVYERYVASDNTVWEFVSNCAGTTPQAILEARTIQLNTRFEEETVAEEKVAATKMPIKRYAFILRFTIQERIALRTSVDPIVVDFRELLEKYATEYVDMTDPLLYQGLGYCEMIGLLAPGRAAEIGA